MPVDSHHSAYPKTIGSPDDCKKMFIELLQVANICCTSCVSTMELLLYFLEDSTLLLHFHTNSGFRTNGTDLYLLHTSHASAPAISGLLPEACFLQSVYQVCQPFLRPHARVLCALNRRRKGILRCWKGTFFGHFFPVLQLLQARNILFRCNVALMLLCRHGFCYC